MTKRHKAIASMLACVFFWGFSFVSIKIAIAVFPPMTLGALRFGLAIIVLFIIKRKFAPEERLSKEDLPLLAGAGLTGATLYFFCENNGVSLIPASEASIITAAIPVITLIAERAGEKIIRKGPVDNEGQNNEGQNTRKKYILKKNTGKKKNSLLHKIILPGAGALISMTGVGLVAGVSFALSGTARGYFFMAGACFSWVIYSFLTRPLFARRSRIYIVFWQSFIGFIGFLPFTIFEASWRIPGIEVWGHVLFLGICCSALGYSFYARALETLGAAAASLFLNFVPVVSALGGFIVLGERLQPLQLFGAVLVLAGVYLAMSASGESG